MRRTASMFAVATAALAFTGLGIGSVAHAATGAFGYDHTSDEVHHTVSDPDSDECIDLERSAYKGANGTDLAVVMYKTSDCSGPGLKMKAGTSDDTAFHFHSIKFVSD